MAPNPTGSVRTANEMSVNGMAENAAPAITNATRFWRATRHVRRPKIAKRMSAPIAMRISAVQSGPISGDATCMNRNAPPQTAPRNSSWARWAGVTGLAVARAGAGAWAGGGAIFGVSDRIGKPKRPTREVVGPGRFG